ncbi:DUF6701 domain-containing protein [Thiobacter aerophilum]|uniref:DUF6701 domain-containing protein n=1 Tax=Thiobacter aerophilum TaxID=3121275 RepID=A0ABV0EIR9_9BURK
MLTKRWLVIVACALTALTVSQPVFAWWNTGWAYRVPINVPAGASVNSTVKVDVDFAALLTAVGAVGTFDPASWRVVRADDTTLAATQEWTDMVYGGASDPPGNSRGELRFILQDAGPTTYYLYFDVLASGPKPANPQPPINGNFEVGGTGTQSPPGWSATKANPLFDAQVRPPDIVSVTTDGATVGNGTPPKLTDGTPYTGFYSYLLGARTNNEPNGFVGQAVTLTRSIAVPATNPGNLVFRYRVEGWDASDNGASDFDYLRVRLIGSTTTTLVGPGANNYTSYPFSPNKGLNQASNARSGWGQYNGWDTDTRGIHHAGMTLARGSEPWFTVTAPLAAYAGQTITLEIMARSYFEYRSWYHIDDVEWSVVAATLGTPSTRVVTPGGFNAYDTTTALGSITGFIKTKIAGQPFNLDLIALNATKTAIETGFVGAVKVELLNASNNSGALDANGCRNTWTTIQTLSPNPVFAAADQGRKTVSFQENNAWKDVRVRVSYPATGTPTVVGCSTDNFAIRPATLVWSATDSDWQTAGTTRVLNNGLANGGVVHKAGQPFTLTATAKNAAGNVTANYDGAPSVVAVSCALPTGCSAGTVSPGTWTASGGTVVSNTATYSEVGVISAQLADATFAAVDAADGSTAAERTIPSASQTVGRFVPDHFELSAANVPVFKTFGTTACSPRSFTYIGQPFGYSTVPVATVYAKNAAGQTTMNYAGSLWKLTASSVSQTYISIPATPALTTVLGAPTVASNNDGTGTISVNSSDTLAYTRPPSAPWPAPFNANITLSVSVQDASENGTGQGIITTTAPAIFNGGGSGIAFDSGNAFRYGRLRLSNAHGSERLPLKVPMNAEWFDGTVFRANTDDNCSSFTPSQVSFSNWLRNLNPGETTVTAVNFANGQGSIDLSAPGVGNSGAVTVTLDVPTWLEFPWAGAGPLDPQARATFGIYRGGQNMIYWRERY